MSQKREFNGMHFPSNPEENHQAQRRASLESFSFSNLKYIYIYQEKKREKMFSFQYDLIRLKTSPKDSFLYYSPKKKVTNWKVSDLQVRSICKRLLQVELEWEKAVVLRLPWLRSTRPLAFQALMVRDLEFRHSTLKAVQPVVWSIRSRNALVNRFHQNEERRY